MPSHRETFELWLANNSKSNSTLVTTAVGEKIVSVLRDKVGCSKTLSERIRRNKYDLVNIPELGVNDVLCIPHSVKSSFGFYRRIAYKEEVFDILERMHAVEGKHCGYHKTYLRICEFFTNIPRVAVKEFVNTCPTCKLRGPQLNKEPLKPILSTGFLHRCQIDLIDMQSLPDGDHRFIAHYMDHFSKFHIIFPLQRKTGQEVASGLKRYVFAFVGLPMILQSDNGSEFVNKVVEDVIKQWPGNAKILHGRPRHSQSQGLVERGNQTLENMIRAKINETGTANWVTWLPEIQYALNTQVSDTTKKTPYEVVFGQLPNNLDILGVQNTLLDSTDLENLSAYGIGHKNDASVNQLVKKEDDSQMSDKALPKYLKNSRDEITKLLQSTNKLPKITTPMELENHQRKNNIDMCTDDCPELETINDFLFETFPQLQLPNRENVDLMMQVSSKILQSYRQEVATAVGSSHTVASSTSNSAKFYDNTTSPKRKLIRQDVIDKSKAASLKMQQKYNKKIKSECAEFEIGDHVSLRIPKKDQVPFGSKRILCEIKDKSNGKFPLYTLQTSYGNLIHKYPGAELMADPNDTIVPSKHLTKELTLREATRLASNIKFNQKCQCRNGCKNKQCVCRQNSRVCGSSCHKQIMTCKNKKEATTISYSSIKGWLTDIDIQRGQEMLQKQFTGIQGLQDPILKQLKMFKKVSGSFVQVLNINDNHWVTISNFGSNSGALVKVYDSLATGTVSQDLKDQISCIVSSTSIAIALMNTCSQSGGDDCGLYALAYATDLCQGIDPVNRRYEQSQIRAHYEQCLNSGAITSFPSVEHHPSPLVTKIVLST